MKKNLRIVSAAAALLAVAASAVSTVNASAITSVNHLNTVTLPDNGAAVNVKPNISLNTSVPNTDIRLLFQYHSQLLLTVLLLFQTSLQMLQTLNFGKIQRM